MDVLRFRQIHLDFHTSEKIAGIGSEFDAGAFADTLNRAHVNSVTVFSRCHHGMIYHDTRFPARHPHLTRNLLGEQISACHRADIRCPIYISVGLDEYMAREHPEWLEVDASGRLCGAGPLQPGWRKLCFASPYIDYVIEQTEEVLDLFGDEVDGFFFDIIHQGGVHSRWCLAEYERQGWDASDPRCQAALRDLLLTRYRERITAAVRRRRPDCTIFHNAGHIYPTWRPLLHTYSHLELESLPSGGWGANHFPITMRYARRLGLECMGMTAKFAKTWGHFNSYKPQAALEYECFQMLALGARCSVGDQLPPSGALDAATYRLIGAVYEQVGRREPWCEGAEPVAEVAVYNVEATGREDGRVDSSNLGAFRALQEGRHQFDLVDSESDWTPYRVLVLADKVRFSPAMARKAEAYLAGGGAILASHESGLAEDGSGFPVDGWPAVWGGELLPYHPDFLAVESSFAEGLADAQFVMYERGARVRPASGAEALAQVWEPYFNRTWEHFCSHHHTPCERRGPDPGVLRKGRIVYFAHPVFACYARHGMAFYRIVALTALRLLLPDPLVMTDAPSTLHVAWNRQPAHGREVIHLLHYIPERRMLAEDTVEDVIPLHDVRLRLRVNGVRRAYLAPDDTELEAAPAGVYTEVRVPVLRGHAMVVLER
ncbi:MAG TPA: alpha-amylase family protein [Chthonomonadales bacterium]|nr:alpha-amylase family protein [Chthonomonadales bacterium]